MSEVPCRPCQDGEHDRCTEPLTGGPGSGFDLGCCCDLLDRDDGREP